MITHHGTHGEYGPELVFRLDGVGTLLWRASMPSVPATDSFVGRIEDGGSDVTVWYKVESVKYEFYHRAGTYTAPGGAQVAYVPDTENFGVAVYVSVVP